MESLPYGEDAGRAQGGSEKGQENSLHDFFLHYTASVTNLSLEEKYVCRFRDWDLPANAASEVFPVFVLKYLLMVDSSFPGR